MKLVLETLSLETAYREKKDWQLQGFRTRVTEVRKVFKGGWQRVYRVWIGKKIRHWNY